jgi:transposase-like protein
MSVAWLSMLMPSYGDEVACPSCGGAHVVRVGEINPRRQIKFVCSSCGGTVTMEHNGSLAVVRPPETRKLLKLNFNNAD